MQKKNHFRGEPSREQIRETQKKVGGCGHNRQPYKIWARLQSVSITQVWPDQDVNLQQAMLLTSSFFFRSCCQELAYQGRNSVQIRIPVNGASF